MAEMSRQNQVPSRPRTSPEEAEKAGRPWWLKGRERREGRRREGPQKEGRPGTREEAVRRAGAPGPEGEGAALSPESALALPGRGPGAQVYQLGRPRRHARGQALSLVPGGPSRARADIGSIGGHWPGQVCRTPSPSSLLAAAFVQARPLRCGPEARRCPAGGPAAESAGLARPLLRPTCAPARPAARPPGRCPAQPGPPPARPSAGRGRRLGHARRGPHAGGSPGRAHGQSAGPRPRAAGLLTSAAARSAPARPAPVSPRPVSPRPRKPG